jgi:hypothetical protein
MARPWLTMGSWRGSWLRFRNWQDANGDLWAHDEAEDKAIVNGLMQDFRRALKPPPRVKPQ